MDAHTPPADARAVRQRLNGLVALAPGAAAGMVLSVVVGAGVSVAWLLMLAGALDAVLGRRLATVADLAWPLVWLSLLAVLRALCAAGVERWGQRLATAVKSHVRAQVVATVLTRDPRLSFRRLGAVAGNGESPDRTGEIVADLTDGVEKLDPYYRRYLPQLVSATITPILVIAAAVAIDPPSAAILAITAPLVVVFLWLLGTRAEALARRQWRTLRRLSGLFLDTLQGLTTTILFGRATEAIARLDASGEDYRAATMGVLRTAFLSGLVLELAATLSTALVAVGVGVRLIEGWVTFGPAIAVLLLTPELYAPIRQLGQRRHAAMEAIVAAERLLESMPSGAAFSRLLKNPATAAQKRRGSEALKRFPGLSALLRSCAPAPLAAAGLVQQPVGRAERLAIEPVRFEGVTFRYPNAQSDALSSIDLELRPRTLTAIVGPSGAGKSTLVDLLLRFAAPTTGVIRSDGLDIAELDARDWRQRIAFVPQRPHFFDGSVLDNLRIGRADAPLAEVRIAAQRAAIDAFVRRLPRGYDTSLGEMAGRASAGERQRLAVARALVRDAPLLVLDEPSSSLDPVTEATIARVIVEESRRRIVLVVAHRLRTVRSADRLIVLEHGRIVEAGRHDDLVQRAGLYARFIALVDPELEAAR